MYNCLFAYNKEIGPTSHDIVSRTRTLLGTKKVGHAGTLDPLASGVLLLGVGQATKLLGLVGLSKKTYCTTLAFGYETTTLDREGEVIREASVSKDIFDATFARKILRSFIGRYSQKVPAYSAVKVNGEKLYALARKQQSTQVETESLLDIAALCPSREVEIYEATLLDMNPDELTWTIEVSVSKGCYIRSLVRDIGYALDTCATVLALKRSAIGSIGLQDCTSPEELSARSSRPLDPLKLMGIPGLQISSNQQQAAFHGNELLLDCTELQVGLVYNNELVGIWEKKGKRGVATKMAKEQKPCWYTCKTNLPSGVSLPPLPKNVTGLFR